MQCVRTGVVSPLHFSAGASELEPEGLPEMWPPRSGRGWTQLSVRGGEMWHVIAPGDFESREQHKAELQTPA